MCGSAYRYKKQAKDRLLYLNIVKEEVTTIVHLVCCF